jgi:hypothetical protein
MTKDMLEYLSLQCQGVLPLDKGLSPCAYHYSTCALCKVFKIIPNIGNLSNTCADFCHRFNITRYATYMFCTLLLTYDSLNKKTSRCAIVQNFYYMSKSQIQAMNFKIFIHEYRKYFTIVVQKPLQSGTRMC